MKGYGGRLSGIRKGGNHNNSRECNKISCPLLTVTVTQSSSVRSIGGEYINSRSFSHR